MKKYGYLPILLLAVFLLLCACAQNVTDQPETTPSSSSPVQLNSKPATKPTSIPTIIPTVVTQPTAKPTTAPIKPTTKPTTAPTQPAVPLTTDPWWVTPTTAPTQPSAKPTQPITQPTDPNPEWLTDRQVVPFEDRFAEDVLFGYNVTSWLMPDDRYPEYYLEYYLMRNPTYFSYPYIMMEQGIEESERVYKIPIYLDRLSGMTTLAVDGRWAYFANEYELCRLELLTGELTTLATRNEGDLRWAVRACGKDTVCIFQLDADRNLRVYYRDLHSEAERTLYQGILPDVPTSKNGLMFYAPTTTQGQAYWEMLNPAYYQVYLQELNNPNSTLKNAADFPKAVQDHYNIPMLVRYTCDFTTGTLTEDFGLYDTCWNTRNCNHDHFAYESPRVENPTVLDVAPVKIPNFSKLIGEHPFWTFDHVYTCLFSDFGYSHAYWRGESYVHKITDFPVTDMDMSEEYIYAITLDGRILQFDRYNTICNTVYSSDNELRNLYSRGDYVYFVDGDTVICINEATGTWRPILQVSSEVVGFWWDPAYENSINVYLRSGMDYQQYRFDHQHYKLPENEEDANFDTTDGLAFRDFGPNSIVLMPNWKYTEGTLEHLYWVVESTKEVFVICDEPVAQYQATDTHVFFVKQSEPTKIYVVPIGDFTNHHLYYESSDGDITDIDYMFYSQGEIRNYLQFVVDEKRFVMLNMTTNELAVILEAYEINRAFTYDPDGEWITFEGTLTEGGKGGLYLYNRFTGELIEDTDCDCEECV